MSIDDFNDALNSKIDFNMIRSSLELKCNVTDLDNIKRILDNVAN